MTVAHRIRKWISIRGTKVDIKLHRSLNGVIITKSGTSKKVLDVLIEAVRGRGSVNTMEAAKRTKISHEKLLTETGLDKGSILRVVSSDDHVINIEQNRVQP
jgi:hypothetical protein